MLLRMRAGVAFLLAFLFVRVGESLFEAAPTPVPPPSHVTHALADNPYGQVEFVRVRKRIARRLAALAAKTASANEITDKTFETTVQKTDQVILLFGSATCDACAAVEQTFSQVSGKHQRVLFSRVNIDTQRGLAARFNIHDTPTVIGFAQGHDVWTHMGVLDAQTLEQLIADMPSAFGGPKIIFVGGQRGRN